MSDPSAEKLSLVRCLDSNRPELPREVLAMDNSRYDSNVSMQLPHPFLRVIIAWKAIPLIEFEFLPF